MELALTNRTLTAREAEAIGLVTRVVPDDQLIAQAESLANELAYGATRAYSGVKRLLYGAATNPLYEQMELENESIVDMARSSGRGDHNRQERETARPVSAAQERPAHAPPRGWTREGLDRRRLRRAIAA
jgi:enoyl-CoA hydratase/carnithine racemase